MCTTSNGIVKWLGNEKGTSPRRRRQCDGVVYIYVVYYIIRRLYVPGIVTYKKSECERERKKNSFPHMYICVGSSVTLERVWVSALGLYTYIFMNTGICDSNLRLLKCTYRILAITYAAAATDGRPCQVASFWKLFICFLRYPLRVPTYPSPIIHYPSDSITHTPAPRKSVQKPEYRTYYIVYSTYKVVYSLVHIIRIYNTI